MIFILGIITGLILAVLAILTVKKTETTVQRTLKQVQSKILPKGEILEPEVESFQEWVDSLKDENGV